MKKIDSIYNILETIAPKKIVFLTQTDPFELLICVILSAQTTDENVNKVSKDLFKAYPDCSSLANAKLEDVEKLIYKTGFYKAKAKNIINCSKSLVNNFNSTVPSSIDDLISLSGVGRKTANVITGHIYNKPSIIVDTHFKRMCLRLNLVTKDDPLVIEKEIKAILDPSKQYRFSMTLNWFGRTVCKSRKPICSNCPLTSYCEYNK